MTLRYLIPGHLLWKKTQTPKKSSAKTSQQQKHQVVPTSSSKIPSFLAFRGVFFNETKWQPLSKRSCKASHWLSSLLALGLPSKVLNDLQLHDRFRSKILHKTKNEKYGNSWYLSYFTGRVRFLIQLKGWFELWSLRGFHRSLGNGELVFYANSWANSWGLCRQNDGFFRASFWAQNLNSVVIGYAAVFTDENCQNALGIWITTECAKASKINLPVCRSLLKSIIGTNQ